MALLEKIIKLKDEKYKLFTQKLIPTVNPDQIIGVKTPVLREFAKNLSIDEQREHLNSLPHHYHEENLLHGFIIEREKDCIRCLQLLDEFLPFVDNWAVCDSIRPKVFEKNKDNLLVAIRRWIKSNSVYAVRFAIEMLMVYYLDDDFTDEFPQLVASIKSDEYYIKMMQAWYFATALAKKWDEVIPYITNNSLDTWTHNKAIQKSIESFRITAQNKLYLRSLKIKQKPLP